MKFSSNLAEILDLTSGVDSGYKAGKNLEQRLTGRFYTHPRIGRAMAREIVSRIKKTDELRIIDPFCGDGRLLCWLLEALAECNKLPTGKLHVSAWDCDSVAVNEAKKNLALVLLKTKVAISDLDIISVDSFEYAHGKLMSYDVCITNPPWENIKPDSKELSMLDQDAKNRYIDLLKKKVFRLEVAYPHSKPLKKFSGWGANLARAGIEASMKLVAREGVFGIVAPASIFGDQISAPLRHWIFSQHCIESIHHFPAEAKLFEGVDQSAIYFVGGRNVEFNDNASLEVVQHPKNELNAIPSNFKLTRDSLEENNYAIGFGGAPGIIRVMSYFTDLPRVGDFEDFFKIGRELDETGIASKLSAQGKVRFIKGRNINRYTNILGEAVYLVSATTVPQSTNSPRLVWRDVARQSSARRMIATIVPAGVVTGNSLSVLLLKQYNPVMLFAILGVFNSIVFEAQVRANISTNHLSVGAIRRLKLPKLSDEIYLKKVSSLVELQLNSPAELSYAAIEIEVAKWYGLKKSSFIDLLDSMVQYLHLEICEIKNLIEQEHSTWF